MLFRSLIATQFLALILISPAMKQLAPKIGLPRAKLLTSIGLGLLVSAQLVYLFTNAKLFYSDVVQRGVAVVEQNFPTSTIAVINIPPLAALIPPEREYQMLSTYGLPSIGPNPLDAELNDRPQVVIINEKNPPLEEQYQKVLKDYYQRTAVVDELTMYARR